ncbi:hypothetical protein VTK73DRAFT_2775 [Phialemonium thermophilum]|uniref:MYND-type domain-containing protein n=1 Tax=Phialemonium thermophilum TaxID=223376 RepID=A0ABR3X2T5_9PEZI
MDASGNWEGQTSETLGPDGNEHSRPARKAFHEDETVSKYILDNITSASARFKIAASNIASPGSGLFSVDDISPNKEIFRSKISLAAVEPSTDTVCHHCFWDSQDEPHPNEPQPVDTLSRVRSVSLCSGCHVSRFCSKNCQKLAWKAFHKDECKILSETPHMVSAHLLLFRLLLWHRRGRLPGGFCRTLCFMESHFADYSETSKADGIFQVVMAARTMTETKLALRVVWHLLPAILSNAVVIGSPMSKQPPTLALDPAASVINHACSPNAFLFLDDGHIKVRSHQTGQFLKEVHFFNCYCNRCKSELGEVEALFDKNTRKLGVFYQAQRDLTALLSRWHHATKRSSMFYQDPDVYPEKMESDMRTIARRAFPESHWPDHIEPLPFVRNCIAHMYLNQHRHMMATRCGPGNTAAALRNVLRAALASPYRSTPHWVSFLFGLVSILVQALAAPHISEDEHYPAIFADASFPCPAEMRLILCGFAFELSTDAARVFGEETPMVKALAELYDDVARRMGLTGGDECPKPGEEGFERGFQAAQEKFLAWAGMERCYGIALV